MSSIIVSKSGGLIYHYDHNVPARETEKTFSFPLDIKLEMEHKRIAVVFGERDGIKIGHSLLAVNGTKVRVENGKAFIENDGNDGKDVFEVRSVQIRTVDFDLSKCDLLKQVRFKKDFLFKQDFTLSKMKE